MGRDLVAAVVTILTAIIGIAIIAVLVGRGSQTSAVISSAGNAFSGILRQAVAPVSGGGIA